MEKLAFSINRWLSWEPAKNGFANCTKFDQDTIHHSLEKKPDVSFLPAMQRRRLSPLARVVFQALNHCIDAQTQTPIIFSSHFGEINRTFTILDDINQKQPISPMAFSLSVHNAIAGQWSIATANKAPMIALAPGRTGPLAALLEACGFLQENDYSSVTIVLYDENLPAFYQPFTESPQAPQAIAMQISACSNQNRQRQFQLQRIASKQQYCLKQNHIIKLLSGDSHQYVMGENENRWYWQKINA